MDYDNIIKILNEESKVIAIKTDTVYGLVCNAFDKLAINKIYNIKNREAKKPISLFVKNIDYLKNIIDLSCLNDYVLNIMNKYWPGPLTIIFNLKNNNYSYLSNNNTIGIRIPNDKDLLYILNKIDFPLAQTSCNISGEKEYKNYKEIVKNFGDKVDLIVDGGLVTNNIPSTVISVINNKIEIIRDGEIKIDV